MIDTFISLEKPASAEFAGEVQKLLRHYFGCAEVECHDKGLIVRHRSEILHASAAQIVEHFHRSYRPGTERVLKEPSARLRPSCCFYHETRTEIMPGFYAQDPSWQKDLHKLRQAIQSFFKAISGGFHYEVPSLIRTEALNTAGYLKKFPHVVSHLTRLRDDYWSTVEASQKAFDEYKDDELHLTGTSLNPVTCLQVLSNASAFTPSHIPATVSIEGHVFRHEARRYGPGRLGEFPMFELVHIGDPDSCREFFQNALERFHAFFTDLGLPVRLVTASDMFFGEAAMLRRSMQLAGNFKVEARVSLQNGEDLSIGSVNQHGSYFAKAFQLDQSLGAAETACAGIGLDRVVLALRHYGLADSQSAHSKDAQP